MGAIITMLSLALLQPLTHSLTHYSTLYLVGSQPMEYWNADFRETTHCQSIRVLLLFPAKENESDGQTFRGGIKPIFLYYGIEFLYFAKLCMLSMRS